MLPCAVDFKAEKGKENENGLPHKIHEMYVKHKKKTQKLVKKVVRNICM